MKRAFAIIIVVLLGLGMIGLVFPAFLQQQQSVATPQVQYTTIPVTSTSTTTK